MKRPATLLLALFAACGSDTPSASPDLSATGPLATGTGTTGDPPPTPELAPKTVVVVGKQDFGRILQGDNPRMRFELRNEGEGSLVIERFKASCGCTDVTAEPRLVPPGEPCYIDVTFKSQGRHGKQARTVTVFTNDPERPRIRLKVLAEIYRIVNPEPEHMKFGDVLQGEVAHGSVEMSSSDGSGFVVTGIECADPNLAFEWEQVQEDPPRWRIDATLSESAPLGWAGLAPVWVKVDHDRHERIKLHLEGLVKLPVRIEPESSLDVGVLTREPVERTIQITNLRAETPLETPMVSVVSSVNRILARAGGGYEELVRAEVHEVDPGQRYEVVVRVDDRIPQPVFVALVQLHIGGEGTRPHTIALRGKKKMERPR